MSGFRSFVVFGVVSLFLVSNAGAVLILNNGEYLANGRISVRLERGALLFSATGPQSGTFASDEDSGWECREVIDWDGFDEADVRHDLKGVAWVRAKLDSDYRNERQREATEAARDAYATDHKGYECSFTFEPAIELSDDLESQLQRGIEIDDAWFKNVWEVTSAYSQKTSWGYSALAGLLRSLSRPGDHDKEGFWVRDRDGNKVFRCQSGRAFASFPCWHG